MKEQRAERLLYLMTQLPDELLDEAIAYQKPVSRIIPRISFWNKGALVAACLCVCLIGGLSWSAWRESVLETGSIGPTGAGVTMGGVSAGGAVSGQEVKPTLAPSTEQTGARPVDSTSETPEDGTGREGGDPAGTVGMMVSEFWYEGRLYVDTGVFLEELPESCVLLEPALEADRLTKDKDLIGANVYRREGDHTGLYVEVEDGYRYYGRGSAGE